MKRGFLGIFIVVVMVLGVSGSVFALNSGEFMFKMSGNDSNTPEATLEEKIEEWFLNEKNITIDVDLDFHAKVDAPSIGSSELGIDYVGNPNDSKSGTWTSDTSVEFYSVKAGNGFALYWVEGGATSGQWDTSDRRNKGISHLSVWAGGSGGNPGQPPIVPEPGTMFLLGTGLLGLMGFGRKKFFKK